ncbi:hypothetical protein B5V46_12975 [Rhodovulum sp. MB263]|nr:hypothetical protein B5V46_12975 [Rhodovulum sp. MB263]
MSMWKLRSIMSYVCSCFANSFVYGLDRTCSNACDRSKIRLTAWERETLILISRASWMTVGSSKRRRFVASSLDGTKSQKPVFATSSAR